MKAIYDEIGINYSVTRCTDPEIAKQLYSELRGATRIVNIGAGTGLQQKSSLLLPGIPNPNHFGLPEITFQKSMKWINVFSPS